MRSPGRRLVVLSGCSGGGKSTLLAELAARGHAVVPEPGRRIVEAETARGGNALPWVDLEAFLRRAASLALEDWESASCLDGLVFFDRGLVDAASALEALTGEAPPASLSGRYDRRVFMAPPWPDIFATDEARRHGYDAALAEYGRLCRSYPALGYEMTELPRMAVRQRADFVLQALGGSDRPAGAPGAYSIGPKIELDFRKA